MNFAILATAVALALPAAAGAFPFTGVTGNGSGMISYDPGSFVLTGSGSFDARHTVYDKATRTFTTTTLPGFYDLSIQLGGPLLIDSRVRSVDFTRSGYRESIVTMSSQVIGVDLSVRSAADPSFNIFTLDMESTHPLLTFDAEAYIYNPDGVFPSDRWFRSINPYVVDLLRQWRVDPNAFSSDFPGNGADVANRGFEFYFALPVPPAYAAANYTDYDGPVLDPFTVAHNLSLRADVPEPATWALMITGFGLVGATLRRRPTTA